jgi:photosynthetic reaction center cytochrome c subunit
VAATGVTCYTCHRGQPVPAQVWFNETGPRHAGGASAESDGHNTVSRQAGLTSIDVNVLSRHLVGNDPLRAAGNHALPTGNTATIKQTENTFGLMIHMSESLGVNCTFCHNTRSHAEWAESPLQRTKAYHGIRMVRELNNQHLLPLTDTFPAARRGPSGDVAKVACGTCHQGIHKPLGGAPLAKAHPAALLAAGAAVAASAPSTTSVPAAATTTVAAVQAPAERLAAVFFAVGRDDLDAAGQQALASAAAALKADASLGVALSGYADRSGNPDANLELAKRRAQNVRDALKAVGVEEARIQLKKPEFVIGGDSAEARRVDINPLR